MLAILLFGLPGGFEWVIIGLVLLLLFGGKKIPELMRGLGRGVKEFKDAKGKDDDQLKDDTSAKKEDPK